MNIFIHSSQSLILLPYLIFKMLHNWYMPFNEVKISLLIWTPLEFTMGFGLTGSRIQSAYPGLNGGVPKRLPHPAAAS